MKCSVCHATVTWRGSFEVVDGVKYKYYGCRHCRSLTRGEAVGRMRADEDSVFVWKDI